MCLDSYYQEPHQFRFQVFKDSCTPAEVVLVSGHRMHCGCLVIFFWKTLQHLVQLVLSNSPKLRAPRQKAQNESSQHKKKGNSSHKLTQKLCSKKNVNQTHNLIDNVSENAKYTCENPAILQDPTVPATEDSVQIQPNVA